MEDDKDRLREKLDQKKKGDEERFFAEREKAAIERLRRQNAAAQERRCPKDGALLESVREHGVTIDECPTCRGVWLDRGELETIAARERDSWLGRLFVRLRR